MSYDTLLKVDDLSVQFRHLSLGLWSFTSVLCFVSICCGFWRLYGIQKTYKRSVRGGAICQGIVVAHETVEPLLAGNHDQHAWISIVIIQQFVKLGLALTDFVLISIVTVFPRQHSTRHVYDVSVCTDVPVSGIVYLLVLGVIGAVMAYLRRDFVASLPIMGSQWRTTGTQSSSSIKGMSTNTGCCRWHNIDKTSVFCVLCWLVPVVLVVWWMTLTLLPDYTIGMHVCSTPSVPRADPLLLGISLLILAHFGTFGITCAMLHTLQSFLVYCGQLGSSYPRTSSIFNSDEKSIHMSPNSQPEVQPDNVKHGTNTDVISDQCSKQLPFHEAVFLWLRMTSVWLPWLQGTVIVSIFSNENVDTNSIHLLLAVYGTFVTMWSHLINY